MPPRTRILLEGNLLLEQQQKEKGGSGRDSRKKQWVEGSQSSHPSVGVRSVPGYQGSSSLTTFPHNGFLEWTSTPCPTCWETSIPGFVLEIVGCVISAGQAEVLEWLNIVVEGLVVGARHRQERLGSGFCHDSSGYAQVSQCKWLQNLVVTTPVGEILLVDCVYRSYVVSIGGRELLANLIAPDMVDFDVIQAGIGWLLTMLPWIVITR
ncbi:Retroviral aspartyl protease [Sesbania bispinosa]|nr:Retroviral aspartyl protease [Sesbania bispinosa]